MIKLTLLFAVLVLYCVTIQCFNREEEFDYQKELDDKEKLGERQKRLWVLHRCFVRRRASRHYHASHWSAWSFCSNPCGIGKQRRGRLLMGHCPGRPRYHYQSRNCGQPNGGCAQICNKGYCSCRAGYQKNGRHCININECCSNPCRNGGNCVDKINGYTCACRSGFSGGNCETIIDIDECTLKTHNCHPKATCQHIHGSFKCICSYGYKYSGGRCVLDDALLRQIVGQALSNVSTAIDLTKNYFQTYGAKSPGDLLQLLRYPFWKTAEIAKAGEVFQITVLNSQIATGVTTIVLPRQLRDQLSKLSGCRNIRRTPQCSTSKFRTVDGSCNNINNPLWGASATPFNRLLKPYYENGFNTPIGWRYSHRIPSARLVSRELLSSVNITDDPLFTHMLMQWGQFMDHDMDLTPASQTNVGYGTTISCNNTCENQHPCFPIQIPAGDRRIRNQQCLTFIRSSAACSVGPREQINDLTSYIDASNVYGSSKNLSDALRDLRGNKGLLRTGSIGPSGKPFLPFNTDSSITVECGESESGSRQSCFLAGDLRANEQLGLSALHTIWMREHNRIAKSLANINPHWDGERIYQESRKIVGAELQHITFTEWLPKILGPQGMNHIGTYQNYDPNVDASIVNAFATAAFRFGHSTIQPELQRLDQSFQPIRQGNIPLHKAFFAPSRLINEGGIDPLLRGLFGSPTKFNGDTRRPMNTELTERLFELANSIAMDLGALNIQRGRDHGLPGYNSWRSFCNLSMANTFDDLANEIKRPEVRAKLQQIYSMPNNIDLFPGGLVEDPLPGSRLGRVFNCIISEQFKRLRSGDRFWYENPGQFTQQQLQELKNVTLAKVLCENGDNITHVQADVFRRVKSANEYISCSSIPGMDLNFWMEKRPDKDECTLQTHNCHVQPTCQNIHGSFTCICSYGYNYSGGRCVLDDALLHQIVGQALSNVSTAIDLTKNYFQTYGAKSPGDLLQLLRYPFWKTAEIAKAGEVFQITVLNSQIATGVTTIVLPRQLRDQLSKLSGCRNIRRTPQCSTSKFRTVDGSCNNINNPLWGASATPFNRLLDPYYENGFNTPIGWRYSHRIPSARLVSRELLSSVNITDDPLFTHMLMQWGQFMDHDMDLTPASQTNVGYGTTISCNNTCENQHPCFPIQIPAGDRRIRNQQCLTFIRSSAACSVGPREQINDLTSYIDASNVYGSSKNLSDALRDLRGNKGLLRTGSIGPSGKPFLPFNTDSSITVECGESESGSRQSCFLAGDLRANEQLGLSALHTIWMREHNRIAKSLANLNPHWNGERIYQESRKIVGAELQHITFTEWLPKILGPYGMNHIGTYQSYDPNVDASIVNAFATAAFRFGHSTIQPELQRLNQSFQPIRQGNIPLHKAFFAPNRLINEGGIDPLLRGLFGSPTKFNGDTRRPMNTELTERLFEIANSIAMDLGALNIQRGRDHGLPGYNRWRSFCNLSMANTFDDLANEIKRPEVRAKLQQLYSMPNNTDLFPGGLVEDPLPGSRLGPVFNCIISEQFKRLRSGDRFWYENPGQFTQQQLQELKNVTLAKVLCENGDNITHVQADVFRRVKSANEYISCSSIPGMDLFFWMEQRPDCKDTHDSGFRHCERHAKYLCKRSHTFRNLCKKTCKAC